MIDLSLWFMFPIGILIATIAMTFGIGGAIMFSPFFILVLKLDPVLAIAASLFIEMFGFSSGVIGYLRKKSINFEIVKELIVYAIIGTIIGVTFARIFDGSTLKMILAILLLSLSYKFFISKEKKGRGKRFIFDKICKSNAFLVDCVGKMFCFIGGLLLGLVSSGLGELNEYTLIKRMHLKPSIASGTSVFLVAICAIIGVIAHTIFLIKSGNLGAFREVFSIIVFTVPGVLIGGQIGPHISSKLSISKAEKALGILFLFLSILLILTIF